jgi:carbon monoxide dehydrogenase subunit G
MPHAEGSEVIARSPQDVFAFLADGANNPRWRPGVLDIEKVPGTPDGVGAAYRQGQQGPGGRRIAADYEVTEYEPGSVLGFAVVAGPARPTGRYEISPAEGGGTRVRFSLDWQPRGLARLLAPAVARQMPKEIAHLSRLKSVLEQGA